MPDHPYLFAGLGLLVLVGIAMIVKYPWAKIRIKTPLGEAEFEGGDKGEAGDTNPSTAVTVKAEGGTAAVTAGRDAQVTVKTGADTDSMLARIESANQRIGQLGEELRNSEDEKKQLRAALERAEAGAKTGEPEAREAIEDIRKSGDAEKLLEYLAGQRDKTLASAIEDAIEIDREIAAVAYLTGRIDVAERALKEILAARPRDTDAINRMGQIKELRGDLSGAQGCYERVLGSGEATGNRDDQAIALGNLGIVYKTRGDLDGARERWTKARDLFRDIGMPHMVAKVQGWLDGLDKPGAEGAAKDE